jgi:5-methylcytosine-specific restriction endonuclease McrA
MEKVLLLNGNYDHLSLISFKHAVRLMFRGAVEAVGEEFHAIQGAEAEFRVPKILRLVKLVRYVYKRKVRFSKANVFTRDHHVCQYCQTRITANPTVDHIIPRSQGGKLTWENSVTCCQSCNYKKGGRTPSQAHMSLKKLPYAPTIMEFIHLKLKETGLAETLNQLLRDASNADAGKV